MNLPITTIDHSLSHLRKVQSIHIYHRTRSKLQVILSNSLNIIVARIHSDKVARNGPKTHYSSTAPFEAEGGLFKRTRSDTRFHLDKGHVNKTTVVYVPLNLPATCEAERSSVNANTKIIIACYGRLTA